MDRIHVGPFSIDCVVGVYPHERQTKQTLNVKITLHCDLQSAGQSDRLDDTVDYAALMDKVKAGAKKSCFHLLEAFAQYIAELCLTDKRVAVVDVTVEKPDALPSPVAVEIHRVTPATLRRG